MALIEEPKNLEQEIFEAKEILDTTSQISRFIHVTALFPEKSATQRLSPTHQESPQMVCKETPLVSSNMSEPSSSGSQENAPTSQASSEETVNNLQNSKPPLNTQSPPPTPQLNVNHSSRLSKLNLPTFSGNPL